MTVSFAAAVLSSSIVSGTSLFYAASGELVSPVEREKSTGIGQS